MFEEFKQKKVIGYEAAQVLDDHLALELYNNFNSAKHLATAHNKLVTFGLHGVTVFVDKDTDIDTVVDEVVSKLEAIKKSQRINLRLTFVEGGQLHCKVEPGSEIFDCCKDAIAMAKVESMPVTFDFGGILVLAQMSSTVAGMVEQYNDDRSEFEGKATKTEVRTAVNIRPSVRHNRSNLRELELIAKVCWIGAIISLCIFVAVAFICRECLKMVIVPLGANGNPLGGKQW